MALAFNLFYLLMILFFTAGSVFILYHIVKFSLNRTSSVTMIVVFLSGLAVLFIINLSAFLRININDFVIF